MKKSTIKFLIDDVLVLDNNLHNALYFISIREKLDSAFDELDNNSKTEIENAKKLCKRIIHVLNGGNPFETGFLNKKVEK